MQLCSLIIEYDYYMDAGGPFASGLSIVANLLKLDLECILTYQHTIPCLVTYQQLLMKHKYLIVV